MNKRKDGDYVTITELSKILKVSPATIKHWYKWYENKNFVKPYNLTLPPYFYFDRRRVKCFRKADVPQFVDFQSKINGKYKGIMSEFNAVTKWGNRGKEILNRQGISYKDTQKKVRSRVKSVPENFKI